MPEAADKEPLAEDKKAPPVHVEDAPPPSPIPPLVIIIAVIGVALAIGLLIWLFEAVLHKGGGGVNTGTGVGY